MDRTGCRHSVQRWWPRIPRMGVVFRRDSQAVNLPLCASIDVADNPPLMLRSGPQPCERRDFRTSSAQVSVAADSLGPSVMRRWQWSLVMVASPG